MNHPITQAEETTFYGEEVTQEQFYEVVARQSKAYDADDVQVAAYELAKPILEALLNNEHTKVGFLLAKAKHATCVRRAEFECYGYITTQEFKA